MAKNVLGRGLGDLLAEHRPAVTRESVPGTRPKDSGDLGPGLRVLVLPQGRRNLQRGTRGEEHGLPTSTLIAFSLALADVMMVIAAVFWRARMARPMEASEAWVCVAMVGFGCWLGILSLWSSLRDR